jgi:hypothetical protein
MNRALAVCVVAAAWGCLVFAAGQPAPTPVIGERSSSAKAGLLRQASGVAPSTLQSGEEAFVGDYNLGGAMVRIQRSAQGLQYIQAGNPVHTLVPAGGRKYTSPTIPGASLEFRVDDAGDVDSLYLMFQQTVVHGVRTDGPAPDAATLALLAGTYDLAPTVSALISVRDGRLIYRATGDLKDSVLVPARGLHFAFEGNALVSIRFHLDSSKRVSHFVIYPGDMSIVGTRRK